MVHDRLDDFGIYKLASQLFDDYWADSEIVMKNDVAENWSNNRLAVSILFVPILKKAMVVDLIKKIRNTSRSPVEKPAKVKVVTGA